MQINPLTFVQKLKRIQKSGSDQVSVAVSERNTLIFNATIRAIDYYGSGGGGERNVSYDITRDVTQLRFTNGMRNYGNTCYLNSVLQCLMGSSAFIQTILVKAREFRRFFSDYSMHECTIDRKSVV